MDARYDVNVFLVVCAKLVGSTSSGGFLVALLHCNTAGISLMFAAVRHLHSVRCENTNKTK